MRTGILIFGALALLIGVVWIGQGANPIAGSFMTGERTWLIAGIVVAASGAALLWWASAGYRRFP